MSEKQDWSKSFMYSLHQVNFLIGKRLEHQLLKAKRISFSQFLVLIALGCCDKVSQRQVAEFLFLSEPTVSRHIESLRKSGHLKKTAHPESRREVVLSLTPKGRTELSRCQQILDTEITLIFKGISEQEGKTLARTIGGILTRLKEDS